MQSQFIAAINQICDEKNIPRDKVLEIVKGALATAYRKDFGNKEQEVDVVLCDDQEFPTVFLIKEVVDEVENANIEITFDEAKKLKKDIEIGDELQIDVTPLGYGRIAAQAAKQVILQRIQEAEREILYEMFKNREDEVLTAQVTRVEGQNVYLSIEKNTVLLTAKNRIPSEQYYTGKRIRVYLDKVEKTTKGPQLLISRTHPSLVKRLLEAEIPEIRNAEVMVRAISRDAGFRSKVAVSSEDVKIDPIGACVGQKGVRIQAVMEELNGERVDMIQWYDDPVKFIATSLQPAQISAVLIVNDEDYRDEKGKLVKKRAAVFVEESQRPMAIGKKGQNIRLASDLTGYELDVYNADEVEAFKKKLKQVTGEEKEAITVTGVAGKHSKIKRPLACLQCGIRLKDPYADVCENCGVALQSGEEASSKIKTPVDTPVENEQESAQEVTPDSAQDDEKEDKNDDAKVEKTEDKKTKKTAKKDDTKKVKKAPKKTAKKDDSKAEKVDKKVTAKKGKVDKKAKKTPKKTVKKAATEEGKVNKKEKKTAKKDKAEDA